MDDEKVKALAYRVVADVAGAFTTAQGYIGDRLGLFRALAGGRRLTSTELASELGLEERYVREWAKAMVAAEYLETDPETSRFFLTGEQEEVLVKEDGPAFSAGLFHTGVPFVFNTPRVMEAFRAGGGVPWTELGAELADEIPEATERSLKPDYLHRLTQEWLPGIPGLVERLETGARVADVGCGSGQSTLAVAAAFPRCEVFGIDFDGRSIERARGLAASRGLANVQFRAAPAEDLPKTPGYDLIMSFDCIHDMAHPGRALAAIRDALVEDGLFLWQEPRGSKDALDNRNPVGKFFANLSPLACLTSSLAREGEGLGTLMGEARAREIAARAGFSRFETLAIPHPFRQFFLLER